MSYTGTNPNVVDLCRLCLGKDGSLIPVFDSLHSNQILCDKINVCLAIQISVEDRISQKICTNCLIKVDSFYEFRNTTSESQRVLEQWLQDSEIVLKDMNSKEADISNEKELASDYSIPNTSMEDGSDNESETSSDDESSSEESEPLVQEQDQGTVEMQLQQADIINILPVVEVPGPSGLQPQHNEALLEFQCPMFTQYFGKGDSEQLGNCGKEKEENSNSINPDYRMSLKTSECPSNRKTVINKQTKQIVRNTRKNSPESDGVYQNSELVGNETKVRQKFECNICKFTARYKSQLDIHLKRHKKDYTIFCNVCHRGFFYQHEVEMHEALHKEERRFECSVCQKKFVYRHTLVAHAKKHEPLSKRDNCEKETFVCDTCGKSFTSKSYLRKHVHIHSGVNKVICDVCGLVLSNAVVLKAHHRTHTGERPYVCSICGRSFNTKKYMAVHMRIHTGVKPFKCQICEKSFSQRSALNVHKRIHSGERPYECHICKKGFITKTLLKIHQRKHSY